MASPPCHETVSRVGGWRRRALALVPMQAVQGCGDAVGWAQRCRRPTVSAGGVCTPRAPTQPGLLLQQPLSGQPESHTGN